MTVLFWAMVALIAWSYAIYPVLIVALSLVAGRAPRRDEAHEPAVSILIPAYNEERVIGAKIENTLALDYPPGRREILVASESTDGTNDIVRRRETRGVRLLASAVRRGKVANLYHAVGEASGEILVFTDANAMLPPDALRKLVRNFADSRVGAVSGRLVYARPGGSRGAPGEETYWGFEMLVKRASSDLGSLPGANGSLFALRRSLYLPISETRGDDFELPIRVILEGHRSILDPDAVSVETAAQGYRDEYRRKVRIVNWMITSALILLREAMARGRWLIAFQLLSHKLNRWAIAAWLVLLFPASLWLAPRGGIYAAAAAGQAAVYGAGLCGLALRRAGRRPLRMVGLASYFMVVNAAALVGMATCATGRRVAWHKRSDS